MHRLYKTDALLGLNLRQRRGEMPEEHLFLFFVFSASIIWNNLSVKEKNYYPSSIMVELGTEWSSLTYHNLM